MATRGVLRVAEGGYLFFWCPGCGESHMIRARKPGEARGWDFNGDYDRPTFVPSVKVEGKRRITDAERDRIMAGEKVEVPDVVCHSYVRDGQIHFLGDCTHGLAGQTVPLAPFDA
jgi:hypothetical protein